MRSICVIFNPAAGRRRAARRIEAFRRRWSDVADFRPTESAGQAALLVREAAGQGYRTVAAAGGDGTIHEAAAGLLAADAPGVTFAVVPVGSANDYAFSLTRQFGTAELDDQTGHLVDVGRLRASDGRERFFVESLGVGLTAEVTAESRRIPHRQGLWLYGSAAFRVLRRGQPPLPLRLTWDDEPPVDTRTRLLSVLLGQREGNFLMATQALLDDGLFDVVHGGDVSHWESLRLLPRFLRSGPPENHPQITLRRCRRLQVESAEPLTIHTDGEVFSTGTDGLRAVELEVVPLRLRVKVCRV